MIVLQSEYRSQTRYEWTFSGNVTSERDHTGSLRHNQAVKNILIPVVTVLGLEFGNLIAFSVVTETVFAWPGMGKLIIDAINNLDRPIIVAYLMITVVLFVTINLIVDIIYSLLDPRVRLGDLKR